MFSSSRGWEIGICGCHISKYFLPIQLRSIYRFINNLLNLRSIQPSSVSSCVSQMWVFSSTKLRTKTNPVVLLFVPRASLSVVLRRRISCLELMSKVCLPKIDIHLPERRVNKALKSRWKRIVSNFLIKHSLKHRSVMKQRITFCWLGHHRLFFTPSLQIDYRSPSVTRNVRCVLCTTE